LRLKNFVTIKTLDNGWGEGMGIVGIVAHSVNVVDELEGTEDDIRVTVLILNALTEKAS
jgi:hypothetical protein